MNENNMFHLIIYFDRVLKSGFWPFLTFLNIVAELEEQCRKEKLKTRALSRETWPLTSQANVQEFLGCFFFKF